MKIFKQSGVSVIINSYNAGDTILRTIQSVLNQTHGDLEVIVYDNCSTDDTYSVVSSIRDSRLSIHSSVEHLPLGLARNNAVKLATGKYLAFCDADDWWLPEKINLQRNALSGSEYIFICSDFLIDDRLKNKYYRKYPYRCGEVLDQCSLLIDYNVGFLTLFTYTQLVKDVLSDDSSGLHYIWDMDLVYRLASLGKGYFFPYLTSFNTVAAKCLSQAYSNNLKCEDAEWRRKLILAGSIHSRAALIYSLYLIQRIKPSQNDQKGTSSILIFIFGSSIRAYRVIGIYLLRIINYLTQVREFFCSLMMRGQYEYFINETMELPPMFRAIVPKGVKVSAIYPSDIDSVRRVTEFLLNSTIFSPKEISEYKNYVIYTAEDEAHGLIHATIVHLAVCDSPVRRHMNFRRMKNVSYLSTGYTLSSYKKSPISLIVLNRILADLSSDHGIVSTINVIHPSTQNASLYFTRLGFKPLKRKFGFLFGGNIYNRLVKVLCN